MSTKNVSGDADVEVCGLFYDSRLVQEGGLFFALRGEQADGHLFIDRAIKAGARAVVMESPRSLPDDVVGIEVKSSRRALAMAASAYYGFPTRNIPVVGVTGTNGKTTTTYLLESVLEAAGRPAAVFGTINYRFAGRVHPSEHTTPESVDLLEMVDNFKRAGAKALVLEISSHALAQHRADGLDFNVGVFTNLTPEHLDYHGDMEGYFQSKERFFSQLLPASGGRAVVNIDDPYGCRLAAGHPAALTYGLAAEADVRPVSTEMSLQGIHCTVATPVGQVEIRSGLLGGFNVYNLLATVAASIALGIDPADIARGLTRASQVPGRMERIENDLGFVILVDYAHTGDALEKALFAVKELSPRRIITVFGCGGDRDRSKRPIMGEVAARHSDLAIATSDNPRGEDPSAILEEVFEGCRRIWQAPLTRKQAATEDARGFLGIEDRRQAIRFAVSCLGAGDVLLVAGKGHEDYQIVGKDRLHFDDREELRSALADLEVRR